MKLFKSKDKRLKAAFKAVKTDMDLLEENDKTLKDSVNEWVMFLDQENRALKIRTKELEKRLDMISNALNEEQLSVLKSV